MRKLSTDLEQRVAASVTQLRAAVADYQRVCYASSLGLESAVLSDLIWEQVPEIEIFSIDTGRLFPQTHELIGRQQQRYGRAVRLVYPQTAALEAWVEKNGVNGFRDSVEMRQGCCAVRKVEPFRRAIAGYKAWVTGIRRGQSSSRALAPAIEWDAAHGIHKLSPLLDWSEREIWTYVRARRLPYNALHDLGFPSIGCAPCTRAVQPGEDARAGRWWWERSAHRECGLHPRREASAGALVSPEAKVLRPSP